MSEIAVYRFLVRRQESWERKEKYPELNRQTAFDYAYGKKVARFEGKKRTKTGEISNLLEMSEFCAEG